MSSGDSSPASLVNQLRLRQSNAWEAGTPLKVEELIGELAPNAISDDDILELLYGEICLAQAAGKHCAESDCVSRFPQLEDRIRRLFEMHEAFEDAAGTGESLLEVSRSQEARRLIALTTDLGDLNVRSGAIPLPEKVGRYEVVELIGEGGMGIVLKVKQPGAERYVALKMISAAVSESMLGRFRTEMESAARLQHPNIVPIFDVGEHNGLPFFTMAYIRGDNLKQLIRDRSISQRAAAELVSTLATAVAFAHERGIVHRDLKPANVLVDKDGTPWLADFGIAKQLDAVDGQTATGQMVGTVSYMSPEQINNSSSVGAATDVYGLGAILYECLTGQNLFESSDLLTLLSQIQTQAPRRPRDIDPDIDAGLEAICLRCLEKEPGDRYASAEAVSDELNRFLEGEPPLVAPLSTLHTIRRVLVQRTTRDCLSSARVGLWNAALTLVVHIIVFFLIVNDLHASWLWLTHIVGTIVLLSVFSHYQYSQFWQLHPVERQSVLVLLAVSIAFASLLLMYLPGWNDPISHCLGMYPPFALVVGVATMSHAAIYSGRWFILGFAFCPLAVVLHYSPEWSPLIFAIVGSTLLALASRDIVSSKN